MTGNGGGGNLISKSTARDVAPSRVLVASRFVADIVRIADTLADLPARHVYG
ncbi:MAG TPA: hypothetical protein VGI98_06610 [Candidatus Limnocylindrales bacterium]|jgi:hypothetical protein